MNLAPIHFIREVLVADYTGKQTPTMQASSSNASCVNPVYRAAAFYESDELRAYYHALGGGRHEGAQMGSTIIIPNRSRWEQLWRIAPDQVQVIENGHAATADALDTTPHTLQHEKASNRNRLIRN